MFNTGKQKLVIGLIIGGAIFTIFFAFPFYVATYNTFSFFVVLFGLGIAISGIIVGLKIAYGNDKNAPQKILDNAYIMNVIVTDRKGEYVFNADMHDPDDLKYVVQLSFPNGGKLELETTPLLLEGIGEGMTGKIAYQGKWLSRFEPYFRDMQ